MHHAALAVTDDKKLILTDELKNDFLTSARTSIFRSGASAPAKILIEKGLLTPGSALNYGKGKFNHDTDAIKNITGHCLGYDYVYQPDVEVLGHSFDNLFSSYVVNTLPPAARKFVYQQMSACTRGVAFLAARTDKIKGEPSEDGVITSINTWQKSYIKDELRLESSQYFAHTVEIKGKAGFSLVACSHESLSDHILSHAKA